MVPRAEISGIFKRRIIIFFDFFNENMYVLKGNFLKLNTINLYLQKEV